MQLQLAHLSFELAWPAEACHSISLMTALISIGFSSFEVDTVVWQMGSSGSTLLSYFHMLHLGQLHHQVQAQTWLRVSWYLHLLPELAGAV